MSSTDEPNGRRKLGTTGVELSSFGLGGEGLLRTWSRGPEAVGLIWRALELGVTMFDTAHAYAASEDYLGAVWGEHQSLRERVFLATKSAERTRQGARRDLEMSLRRLKTGHVDLWQVHNVRSVEEWEQITGPGGAMEAFVQAHQAGLARFIGITGHHSPAVIERALSEFEFHTLMIPVNYAETRLSGFLDRLLPLAVDRGVGVIGMKSMAGGTLPSAGLPAGPLLRFALSQPVATVVVGCEDAAQLEANFEAAQVPYSSDDEAALDVEFDAHELAYYRGDFDLGSLFPGGHITEALSGKALPEAKKNTML
jgi:aryl-alcohol dehydrogenase-like predicted oxidoreductase